MAMATRIASSMLPQSARPRPLRGQVERGAVVDRGADQGQAQRDVDAAPEGGVLEHRQALVVVHRQHAVGVLQVFRLEQGVGRIRAAASMPRARAAARPAR
jgi:hypothetical protein